MQRKIVTPDHETGEITFTGGDIKKPKVEGKFSTKDHTGVMVPVFAYGPVRKRSWASIRIIRC